MNRFLLTAMLAVASVATAEAKYPVAEPKVTIPTPPLGQRWILNDTFSDEFNGAELDSKKWLNYHPTWRGRPPGLFEKHNVAVEDGNLVLSGGLRKEPYIYKAKNGNEDIFDISCAAVVSIAETAHYGYYETRAKANKTSLSTTYWLSRGGNHPVEGNQPEWLASQGGTYGQELDVCETIGRGGSEEEGWKKGPNDFHKGMHSNVHCWYNSPKTGREDMAIKGIPALKPEDGSVLSDGYNIYGCWWKDESNAEFYLNNKSGGSYNFINKDGNPFVMNKPMGVNIVVETYAWIPRPTDDDLNDPTKNRSYYDWVRHYVLVDIAKSVKSDAPEQRDVFEDYIYLGKRGEFSNGTLELQYTAPINRTLIIEIMNSKGKSIATKSYNAHAGFGNGEYKIPAKLDKGENYTTVVYLVEQGSKSSKRYLAGDSFEFTAQ
ncbi:MAG: hypothetical protein SNG35_02225 [Rikenellaceae bacterium]